MQSCSDTIPWVQYHGSFSACGHLPKLCSPGYKMLASLWHPLLCFAQLAFRTKRKNSVGPPHTSLIHRKKNQVGSSFHCIQMEIRADWGKGKHEEGQHLNQGSYLRLTATKATTGRDLSITGTGAIFVKYDSFIAARSLSTRLVKLGTCTIFSLLNPHQSLKRTLEKPCLGPFPETNVHSP